jgi:hypothetical protein
MRSRSFPLRTLLRSLVLAAGPLGVACSSNVVATRMTETVPCTPLDGARYANITPAPGVDGIAFFALTVQDATGKPVRSSVGNSGSPCATARDRAACLAKVEATQSETGWWLYDRTSSYGGEGYGGFRDYGVVTAGDDVRLITTVEELRLAVAPIGSLKEAVAFATISGVQYSCGQPNARIDDDGILFQAISSSCSGRKVEILTKMTSDGRVTMTERELEPKDSNCIEGRRPAGLAPHEEPWLASLPAHFAAIAHMEAAAVIAFADLERDLARVNAPSALRARVARGRLDEVDHAARMTAIARRFGAEPARPEVVVAAGRLPSVLELAIENATEGCVREAYGALVATHQATFAADPSVRAAFERIAADEAQHAELSFDLGDWFASMLSPAEIAMVARAQDAAWAELAAECCVEPAPEVAIGAGMPTAWAARQLLEGLRAHMPRFGARLAA